MLNHEGERVRLNMPLDDAVSFAMGWSDLGYTAPDIGLRQIVGLLAIDALEYSEQWRTATMLRVCLEHRWARRGERG